MNNLPFSKWHGSGNDFVIVDAWATDFNLDYTALARSICDLHQGVGADGLLLLSHSSSADLRMQMWNPDGSLSEMCGNGLRCLALFAKERGYTSDEFTVETDAGPRKCLIVGDSVQADMGPAGMRRGEIGMTGDPQLTFIDQELEGYKATAVSMGNPHLVLFVDDVHKVDLRHIGAHFEHHPLFPNRVNVHFANVVDSSHLEVVHWERGAGATLACGTGVCAVAVAGFATQRAEPNVSVKAPGGQLQVSIQTGMRVQMTGPARKVFEGSWPLGSSTQVVV
ncbi:MAG: diaminopimelate epimerase [Armatimonadetes bacterium]|nr:diaminopimelate epimerase [Armatimonadota bacterium]